MICNLGGTRLEAIRQDIHDLILVKELQDAYGELVVVTGKVTEINSAWVGFQRIDDACG